MPPDIVSESATGISPGHMLPPAGDAQRKALHVKPVKKPKPFAPSVRKVKEIVPNKFVAKLKPLSGIRASL